MKYDAMRWSSQLESACRILCEHSEVDGDQILVALARLAKVALEAGDIYRQVSDDPEVTIHPAFSIAPLKGSLNQTKAMLTAQLLQHSTFDHSSKRISSDSVSQAQFSRICMLPKLLSTSWPYCSQRL
jgi:hypothetical protein